MERMSSENASQTPLRNGLPGTRIQWLLACGALTLLIVVLYSTSLGHGFLNYDDDQYVSANPNLRHGFTATSLRWAFTNTEVAHWQPITWLTHIADYSLYSLNPAGHHFSNILWHVLNACLLFAVLFWFTGAFGRSLLVAAIFAVHPTNVENVAWIAERKTLVCTAFSLLTIAAYGWYALRPTWRRYLLVCSAFALAIMSKSMAVTLPVILLLCDWWPLSRWQRDATPDFPHATKRSTVNLILEKLPLLAISAAVSLLTIHAQEKGKAVSQNALSERLGHAAWSYFAYIFKLIWPSDLSVMYPYPAHPHAMWLVALAVLGLIVLTAIAWWQRARRPAVLFGWLFYGIGMLPVIGIIQVGHQSLADHYLYLPAVGIFLLAAWEGQAWLERAAIRPSVALVLGIAVVTGYASVTAAYLPSWKNSYTLFSRAERLSPSPDFLIETNLGEGLSALRRSDEALPHYRMASELAPQMPLPHFDLGNTLLQAGDPAGAASEFEIALRLSPDLSLRERLLNNLGAAQLGLDQFESAEQNFSAALTIDPNSERSLAGRGQARFRLNHLRDAADDLHHAITLAADPIAYYWLGKILAAEAHEEEAATMYREALRLAPGLADAKTALDAIEKQQPPAVR
jgi:tetratricopeptide (TPR) repeat protein